MGQLFSLAKNCHIRNRYQAHSDRYDHMPECQQQHCFPIYNEKNVMKEVLTFAHWQVGFYCFLNHVFLISRCRMMLHPKTYGIIFGLSLYILNVWALTDVWFGSFGTKHNNNHDFDNKDIMIDHKMCVFSQDGQFIHVLGISNNFKLLTILCRHS